MLKYYKFQEKLDLIKEHLSTIGDKLLLQLP